MVAVVVGLTLAAWAAVSAFRELRPAPADTAADDVASEADDAVADETLEADPDGAAEAAAGCE